MSLHLALAPSLVFIYTGVGEKIDQEFWMEIVRIGAALRIFVEMLGQGLGMVVK